MKNIRILMLMFSLVSATIALFVTETSASGEIKIKLQVVDEEGKALQEADVYVSYEQKFNLLNKKTDYTIFEGKTNKKGEFSSSSHSKTGFVFMQVKKQGYYKSSAKFTLRRDSNNTAEWKGNEIDYVMKLKKIENPVPMYAKRIRKRVPLTENYVGFDLEIGDFVVPYGNGIESDFLFQFSGSFQSNFVKDERLTVQFKNKGDGIQEFVIHPDDHSEFKSPRFAPVDGYIDQLKFSIESRKDEAQKKTGIRDDQNFIFRVRTQLDENGNVIKASYGKIYGSIGYGYSRNGKMFFMFEYYYNPDHTRNLEFDPKQNLFKYPDPMERLDAP